MKFSELTRLEKIGVVEVSSDADLSEPCYDSRAAKLGCAFFAIRGMATDGHDFISDAIGLGAKTIIIDKASKFPAEEAERLGVARIVVRDSREALAHISEEVTRFPSQKLRMIGVTGTNGKTTTTAIIQQLLVAAGVSCGLIGTAGISFGKTALPAIHTTPESLDLSRLLERMVDAGMTACVMEVSSHALSLKRVEAIDFDVAVFTNFSQDHLDFHGSMEEYFAAKKLLFDKLKDTAVAISNADDDRGSQIVEDTSANAHTYGTESGGADLFADQIKFGSTSTQFTLCKRYSDEQAEMTSPLVGRFNLENLLAAASALYFGIEGFDLERLATLTKSIAPVRGRLERIDLPNGGTAFVDYAHTPDALEKALRTLRTLLRKGGKLAVVFGCGGDRDKAKRPIMGKIAEQLADGIWITNDNPRSEPPTEILNQILMGMSTDRCVVVSDRRKAIKEAVLRTGPHDILLVAGKGHETYQIIGSQRSHFNDAEEVRAAMSTHRDRKISEPTEGSI